MFARPGAENKHSCPAPWQNHGNHAAHTHPSAPHGEDARTRVPKQLAALSTFSTVSRRVHAGSPGKGLGTRRIGLLRSYQSRSGMSRNDTLSPASLAVGSSGKCVIISECPKVPLFSMMSCHAEGMSPLGNVNEPRGPASAPGLIRRSRVLLGISRPALVEISGAY